MTSDSDEKSISCNHPYTNTTEDRKKKHTSQCREDRQIVQWVKNKPRKRTT